MDEHEWLPERFEKSRTHLRTVAYRMLGTLSEADDAVQETWLRLSHSDTSGVVNLGGWLTTVVGRVCLDMLRSRMSRREEPTVPPDPRVPDPIMSRTDGNDPEQEALLAESVGLALLVVLETLAPAERLAFVLHDMFDLPFDEIAPIIGRSTTAARQPASRARRRVQGAPTASRADLARQRKGCRDLPRRHAHRRLRCASCGARPGRRAPNRRRHPASWRNERDPRCTDRGQGSARRRTACPVCTSDARARQRRRGNRHGFAWTAVYGRHIQNQAGEDRPGDPQRLTC